MAVLDDILDRGRRARHSSPQVEPPTDDASLDAARAARGYSGAPAIGGTVTETPQAGPVTAPVAPKTMTYADIFDQISTDKPMTAEELEQARKRESRQKLLSAIGDGLSAISNIYLTSKGSPGVKLPSLSARAQARWDKFEAERKAYDAQYKAGRMRAVAMDQQREQSERDWRTRLAIEAGRRQQRATEMEQRERQFGQTQERLAQQHADNLEQKKLDREQRAAQNRVTNQYRGKALEIQQKKARNAASSKGNSRDYVSINIGEGRFIDIPKNRYNPSNIAKVYSLINPSDIQKYEGLTGSLDGLPKMDRMQAIIGAYMSDQSKANSPEYQKVANALMEMSQGNSVVSSNSNPSPAARRVRKDSPAKRVNGTDWD